MSRPDIQREPIVAKRGDTITCPGCNQRLTWRDDNGWKAPDGSYTCRPGYTTHSDHIETLEVK